MGSSFISEVVTSTSQGLSKMKLLVNLLLFAIVLAALSQAVQAASLVKRGFAPETYDSFAAGGYGLRKRPFCNAFDGCGGKKRSDPAFGSSPDVIKALASVGGTGVEDMEALLLNGDYARAKRSADE